MPHVDGYRTNASSAFQPPFPFVMRWDDEDSFPLRVRTTGEPYWNGYVFYTAPHEDDECEVHDPNRKAEV